MMVLAVFWVLRDYGPESAIRKFHQRLLDRDSAQLQTLLEQPISNPESQIFLADINNLISLQARPQVQGMVRRPRLVVADVLYLLPDGRQAIRKFTVERVGRTWQINPGSSGINLFLKQGM